MRDGFIRKKVQKVVSKTGVQISFLGGVDIEVVLLMITADPAPNVLAAAYVF